MRPPYVLPHAGDARRWMQKIHMKRLLPLVFLVSVGCGTVPPQTDLPVIHPKVFSLVECWISDTAEPVLTEINLDAVRENRNQFDHHAIRRDGEWIRADEDREYWRYRVLSRHGNAFVVEFQHNGGGTLTASSRIGFTLATRTLLIDGKKQQVQVMQVDTMQ